MLELKFHCESLQEAHVYLNAQQYLNLLNDLQNALRNARKHGKPTDVLKVFDTFYPEICRACEHDEGAY